MTCRTCDRDEFTIKGFCKHCAPGLHKEHNDLMATYVDLSTEFILETGRHPLKHWPEFEAWCRCH